MTTRAQRQVALNAVVKGPLLFNPAQRRTWTETDWNWHMRKALEMQNFRTFHIREASETGIADLIVYQQGGIGLTHNDQVIRAWIELKKDNSKADSNIPVGQKQFMRDHWRMSKNAIFVMFDRQVDMLAVYQGDLKGRVKMLPPDPYVTNWQEVFAHFKARKVAL